MRLRPAVFLDRDGVIVEEVGPILHPDQLRLLPGAVEGIRRIKAAYLVVVVTNQSAVGRGLMTEDQLDLIHAALAGFLHDRGASVDAIYSCLHAPEVGCPCRKPRPSLLLMAASDWGIDMTRSYMVGDRESDMEAARAAGVRGIRVGKGGEAHDLMAVADMLLARQVRA